jgi:hypothetical protein
MGPVADKKRDWTGFWIVAGCLFLVGCAVFGMAIEVLKFVALVKWIMN